MVRCIFLSLFGMLCWLACSNTYSTYFSTLAGFVDLRVLYAGGRTLLIFREKTEWSRSTKNGMWSKTKPVSSSRVPILLMY